jgi:hypothetical protein
LGKLKNAGAIALIVVAMAGCQAQSAAGTLEPTQIGSATTSAVPVATESTPTGAAVTPASTPEAVAGDAVLRRTGYTLIKYKEFGYVNYQVIIAVHNDGGGWAEITGGDYTVYDSSGGVATTGDFLYAYPRFLGPGETGFVFDESSTNDAPLAAFVKLDGDVLYDLVDGPGAVLKTAHIALVQDSYSGELSAKGTVTNTSSEAVGELVIGVFYFDSRGKLLGASYTNLVDNLAPGQTKGFETVSGPKLRKSSVASTKVFASDLGY